jgi:hypothetical protein
MRKSTSHCLQKSSSRMSLLYFRNWNVLETSNRDRSSADAKVGTGVTSLKKVERPRDVQHQ